LTNRKSSKPFKTFKPLWLEVIEQITYLVFLKRLGEQEIAEELKANREKKPMQKRFFPEGSSNAYKSLRPDAYRRSEA
jgi:hypothetical protein